MKTEWKKPEPALVDRFYAALPDHPAAERKKMFGYPACFVNGNFFAGMHNDSYVVRLPGGLREKFAALASAEVFDPMGTGKGMKDWWLIPAQVSDSEAALTELLAGTFDEVINLPPRSQRPGAPAREKLPSAGLALTRAKERVPARLGTAVD